MTCIAQQDDLVPPIPPSCQAVLHTPTLFTPKCFPLSQYLGLVSFQQFYRDQYPQAEWYSIP